MEATCLGLQAKLAELNAVVAKLPQGDGYMLVSFKHGYVGNDILLWGPNCSHYTCILNEAGVYSAAEALQHHNPPETYMVPRQWVAENFRCVLESQRCGGRPAIQQASEAAAESDRDQKGAEHR